HRSLSEAPMRKVVLFGFVLVCLSAVSFLTVLPIERKVVSSDGTAAMVAAKPTQVEVTNFPAVQAVSGSGVVGNLPAVQTVSGSVSVSNLPLDANGNMKVSGQTSPPFLFTKVANDAVSNPENGFTFLGPFTVGGWKEVRVYFRASFNTFPACVYA